MDKILGGKMTDLYFNFYELFHSDIAEKKGINNTTSDPRILTNLMNLTWYVINPVRIEIYNKFKVGLDLEAGYRCPDLVKTLKSSSTGHPDGECADLKCKALTPLQLFDFIKNLAKQGKIEYDQLILEHNADGDCVHIGYRKGACRHQTTVRTIVGGKFVYKAV